MKHAALDRARALLEGREVLVSFSGGKDSCIVLDLAVRFGARVEAFAMELVPGLAVFDAAMRAAESRWKVPVRRYPHWLRARFAREGVYRFHSDAHYRLDINDVYAVARRDTGIRYIVTGAKKADSLWRRRTGAMKFAKDDLKAPIWDWSTRDVAAYLKARGLTPPQSDGRKASGIDLTHECVTWLHDHHRDDFQTLERQYPFVRAIVKRRDWFQADDTAADAPSG